MTLEEIEAEVFRLSGHGNMATVKGQFLGRLGRGLVHVFQTASGQCSITVIRQTGAGLRQIKGIPSLAVAQALLDMPEQEWESGPASGDECP